MKQRKARSVCFGAGFASRLCSYCRGPEQWPPRRAHLSACDFFLLGCAKQEACRPQARTLCLTGCRSARNILTFKFGTKWYCVYFNILPFNKTKLYTSHTHRDQAVLNHLPYSDAANSHLHMQTFLQKMLLSLCTQKKHHVFLT